jgi:hypothetical protein
MEAIYITTTAMFAVEGLISDFSCVDASPMRVFDSRKKMNDKGLLRGRQISVMRHPSRHEVVFGGWDRDHFTVILCGDVNKPVMNTVRYGRLLSGETVRFTCCLLLRTRENREVVERPGAWFRWLYSTLLKAPSAGGLPHLKKRIRQGQERSLHHFTTGIYRVEVVATLPAQPNCPSREMAAQHGAGVVQYRFIFL